MPGGSVLTRGSGPYPILCYATVDISALILVTRSTSDALQKGLTVLL